MIRTIMVITKMCIELVCLKTFLGNIVACLSFWAPEPAFGGWNPSSITSNCVTVGPFLTKPDKDITHKKKYQTNVFHK